MRSIEATGKNVKLAIQNGCEKLGCSEVEVDIQVLEIGTPGLFGIFGKPAKVLLTVKEKEPDTTIDMPVLSLEEEKKKPAKQKAEKPAAPKAEKAEKPAPKAEKPASKAEKSQTAEPEASEVEEASETEASEAPAKPKRKRHRTRGHGEKKPAEAAETAVEAEPAETSAEAVLFEQEPFEVTPEESLSADAVKARTFLSELCARMDVPAVLELCETSEQLRIRMSGENISLLIGRRGETLDALQYLTSLNVNRGREDYLRVSLDTENYRAKREEALRKLAVRMANRAKKSGRRVALEPMNPYERRILHSALQNDPDVTTHSEGEDPYRRVIITLTR